MSKVVHLAEASHKRAKEFCKAHRLRMTDWVAGLIEEAILEGRTDPTVRSLAPKKKILERLQITPHEIEEPDVPVYAGPPFWAAQRSQLSRK